MPTEEYETDSLIRVDSFEDFEFQFKSDTDANGYKKTIQCSMYDPETFNNVATISKKILDAGLQISYEFIKQLLVECNNQQFAQNLNFSHFAIKLQGIKPKKNELAFYRFAYAIGCFSNKTINDENGNVTTLAEQACDFLCEALEQQVKPDEFPHHSIHDYFYSISEELHPNYEGTEKAFESSIPLNVEPTENFLKLISEKTDGKNFNLLHIFNHYIEFQDECGFTDKLYWPISEVMKNTDLMEACLKKSKEDGKTVPDALRLFENCVPLIKGVEGTSRAEEIMEALQLATQYPKEADKDHALWCGDILGKTGETSSLWDECARIADSTETEIEAASKLFSELAEGMELTKGIRAIRLIIPLLNKYSYLGYDIEKTKGLLYDPNFQMFTIRGEDGEPIQNFAFYIDPDTKDGIIIPINEPTKMDELQQQNARAILEQKMKKHINQYKANGGEINQIYIALSDEKLKEVYCDLERSENPLRKPKLLDNLPKMDQRVFNIDK